MTPQDSRPCPNPGCPNAIDRTPRVGRPRRYCSDACGRAYRKRRSGQPDAIANDMYAATVADEFAQRARELIKLVHTGQSLEALRQLVEAERDWLDVRAAVVQQARDRRNNASAIAAALHISPDKLSRDLSAEAVARRKHNRSKTKVAGPLTRTQDYRRSRNEYKRPGRGESTADKATDAGTGPPTGNTSPNLIRALSRLRRTSRKATTRPGRKNGFSRRPHPGPRVHDTSSTDGGRSLCRPNLPRTTLAKPVPHTAPVCGTAPTRLLRLTRLPSLPAR
ncbi:hypothetical protein SHXM_02957 [Streptomyces hygroscopicus]|nr:hypothetical protein SHXM_02957 [Streptomyces hygroscopicus]